jgi:hypothetical protein
LSNASRTRACVGRTPARRRVFSRPVALISRLPHGGHARPFDEPSANKVSELGVVTLGEIGIVCQQLVGLTMGVLQDGSIVQEISDAQVRQAVLACAH